MSSESKPSTPVSNEKSDEPIEIPIERSEPPLTQDSASSDSWATDSDSSDDDSVNIELPPGISFEWLDEQMRAGVDLRPLLSRILPGLPEDISQSTLYELIMDLFLPMNRRNLLEQYQTLDHAVELIHSKKNILILTGAGISVSCGIPDFRSRNGIYARLHREFPELPDPQAMFDINYFTSDQRPFFRFAKEIWPGQYQPSLAHRFIAELERQDKLLRNYTQNIDSLEHLCSIKRLIQCHGSFSSATCRICHEKVRSDEIKEEILEQKIPHCRKCSNDISDAILKPDIVFFGEQLPDDFYNTIADDKEKCDLLIVMGSSLKVKPVSLVSELINSNTPQILINRERLLHKRFDIELLGNCDVIINELCVRLAKLDSEFEKFALPHQNSLNEISYETLRTELEQQKHKKPKLEDSPTSETKVVIPNPALLSSTSFNPDTSYVSHPPRRYIFSGAEIDFSSDDESSDDDEHLPHKPVSTTTTVE